MFCQEIKEINCLVICKMLCKRENTFKIKNSKIFRLKYDFFSCFRYKNESKMQKLLVTPWTSYTCPKEWCNLRNKVKTVAKDSCCSAVQVKQHISKPFWGYLELNWFPQFSGVPAHKTSSKR